MSRALKIGVWSIAGLLGILVLCILLLMAFDWNRAKPWINSRVSEATDRTFAINGDLSLSWHRTPNDDSGWKSLMPWPMFSASDVTMGNPEWADASPQMAQVDQVVFSVNPLALLGKKIVIPTLMLDQPDLTLQRANDGKNNWTFQSGEPSAWQFQLGRLALNEGQVRIVDAIKNADVEIDIDSIAEEEQADGYRIAWKASGKFDGATVRGTGKAGSLLSLQEQNLDYPINANLRIGKTEIDVQGTLTGPRDLSAVDLRLKLSGASMAHLHAISGISLPETPPFTTEGHLLGTIRENSQDWTYRKFTGKVGSSDLAGTLKYESRKPRPRLSGTLDSKLLRFADLGPLVGADSDESKKKRGAKDTQPDDKALPTQRFRPERWTSIDADIKFNGRKIVRDESLPINNLEAAVQLKDGVLTLAPLKFGIADGTLTSNITLDGRDETIDAKMKLTARHLKLRELFPTFESMKASLGEINGEAALSGSGNSVSALLASSDGEVKAVIDQGAVSKLLLEQIGLNVGSIVLTQLFGDKQVQLNCLVSDFSINDGLMEARTFVVDTEEAVLLIDGNINLAKEQLNLKIKPESKEVRLLSLRAPLYVSGSFKDPDIDVDKGVLAAKAGSAVALGILAPVATAILPLINLGERKESGCHSLVQRVKKDPVTSPPPASNGNQSASPHSAQKD